MYANEVRNAVLHIPLRHNVGKGHWQWEGGEKIPLRFPQEEGDDRVEQISGLIAIPRGLGQHGVSAIGQGAGRFEYSRRQRLGFHRAVIDLAWWFPRR